MDVINLEELIKLAYDNELINLIERDCLLNELEDLQADAEAYNDMLYNEGEEDE